MKLETTRPSSGRMAGPYVLKLRATLMGSGLVIATRPPEGTKVRKGQIVVLVVSLGPRLVAVPDVVGKDQQAKASPKSS